MIFIFQYQATGDVDGKMVAVTTNSYTGYNSGLWPAGTMIMTPGIGNLSNSGEQINNMND